MSKEFTTHDEVLQMNIREACANIIGADLATSIIADMGMHWCVVAAMAEARTPRHDKECAVIRAWRAEQAKQDQEAHCHSAEHGPENDRFI